MRNAESAARMGMTGVYAIVHLASGKRYVGSASKSFRLRLAVHMSELRKFKHHSSTLQRAWSKYGDDAFEFRIVELSPPAWVVDVEQVFIDFYHSCERDFGYNMAPTAGSCRGIKRSPESVEKTAASNRGRKHSPETIEKIAAANRGKKMSPEAIAKTTAAIRGKKKSPEVIEKTASFNRGRKQSPEAIAKQAATTRGRKQSPEAIARRMAGKLMAKAAKVRAAAESLGLSIDDYNKLREAGRRERLRQDGRIYYSLHGRRPSSRRPSSNQQFLAFSD